MRITLLVAGFFFALWGGLVAIRAELDRLGIEARDSRHVVGAFYVGEVDKVLFRKAAPGEYRVAFLGNSMIVSYPKELQIANLLQAYAWRATRGKPPIHVVNLGMEGTGIFDYYFMADVIAEANPSLVIIQFDLASTSQRFRTAFSRPENAGWLASSRIAASASLPLSWVGMTFDRLLLYVTIVRTGLFDHSAALSEEQTRVEDARKQLETALAFDREGDRSSEELYRTRRAFWSLGQSRIAGGDRFTPASMRIHFGAAMDGLPASHPTLQMLEATVRTFRDKGSDVLVYVNPLNMDHLEKTAVLDRAGLDLTLSRVERTVERAGGWFLDLHDVFRDDAFRDAPGHLAYEGGINAPAALAARLAPLVVDAAAARRAPAPAR